ncbi:MAG: hypothetical protein KJ901_17745, partial [Gammaproteobacteria bacterium]|nr:hypothetical protein [Gammaproteobacteria bacterium]MBU1441350.1 hypothetical protein [Gammaproteobacteria bacterium]
MVADSHQLQQELQAVAAGTLGVVRIGAMPVASVALLPAAIRSLKAEPEPLQIDVVEDIALGLWARFERRELDVILGRLDERAFGRQVRSESLFKDPHCVVVGRAHPLVSAARVDWPSAASHPWILPPANTALRRAIDSTFLDRGLPVPLPWIESASGTLIQVLMSQTDCVGVMSGAAARRYRQQGGLAILPLRLKYDVGPVGMIWDAQEPSPALERVLGAVRRAVPEATRKSSASA